MEIIVKGKLEIKPSMAEKISPEIVQRVIQETPYIAASLHFKPVIICEEGGDQTSVWPLIQEFLAEAHGKSFVFKRQENALVLKYSESEKAKVYRLKYNGLMSASLDGPEGWNLLEEFWRLFESLSKIGRKVEVRIVKGSRPGLSVKRLP